MHRITLSLAIISVGLLAYDASAMAPENESGGKRGAAARQGRGGPGAERDPAQMVARMMQEFDKDGDQKLDSAELTALLSSMRQRRGAQMGGQGQGQGQARRGRPGQAQQGRGKPGQGNPGANGQRRRRDSDDPGNPGGERPKRPASD